jgi:hypothetical protein
MVACGAFTVLVTDVRVRRVSRFGRASCVATAASIRVEPGWAHLRIRAVSVDDGDRYGKTSFIRHRRLVTRRVNNLERPAELARARHVRRVQGPAGEGEHRAPKTGLGLGNHRVSVLSVATGGAPRRLSRQRVDNLLTGRTDVNTAGDSWWWRRGPGSWAVAGTRRTYDRRRVDLPVRQTTGPGRKIVSGGPLRGTSPFLPALRLSSAQAMSAWRHQSMATAGCDQSGLKSAARQAPWMPRRRPQPVGKSRRRLVSCRDRPMEGFRRGTL